MKVWPVAFLLGGLLMNATHAEASFSLVDNGKSPYVIVVAKDAIPSERYAAEELQRYLEKMTAVKVPIVDDTAPAGNHELLVGESARTQALGVRIDPAKVGTDGFLLRTRGSQVIIAGGNHL